MSTLYLVRLRYLNAGDRFYLPVPTTDRNFRKIEPICLVYDKRIGNKISSYVESSPDVGGWLDINFLVVAYRE